MSVNDKVLDEITGHSVDLQRLETTVKKRALAIMLLSYDEDLEETLEVDEETLVRIHAVRDGVQKEYGHPLSYVITKSAVIMLMIY